jgi:hypothetical protein
MKAKLTAEVHGHVKIHDRLSGHVYLDKDNAIHPQNMARIIARGLAHENNGWIFELALGNGGTFIDSSLQIQYKTPNTVGTTAQLYNETYAEVVDDADAGVGVGNSVISQPSPTPQITSLVITTCILTADEPAGQAPTDSETTDPESIYTFDELGLKSGDGLLLTHVVFNPIEKTANRELVITYTLTVNVL